MSGRLILFCCLLSLFCQSQELQKDAVILTISPVVDKAAHSEIISTLQLFLQTKNNSPVANEYWLPADFDQYVYPYLDLYNIEQSKHGNDFFRPTLMEILPTMDPNQQVVKIAFIGHQRESFENQLKLIYNLVANRQGDNVVFSKYLPLATKNWKEVQAGSLTYRISPHKTPNPEEIQQQQRDIENLCSFFGTVPIPVTYYSCIHPKELFEIKGFDYHPMMYADQSGGLAEHGQIIFSGNNSECYTHEVVHIYTNQLFPDIPKFLDEGMATYIAGSGKYNYEWQRNKIGQFLAQHPDFKMTGHLDPYEQLYFEEQTPVPYLIAALICERTYRLYGKEKLFQLFQGNADLWKSLNAVGLTPVNIDQELRKELKRPLTSIFY